LAEVPAHLPGLKAEYDRVKVALEAQLPPA
jgi:hypothetical protein